ncbi:MAG: 50S ribosomal protein L18 [bacterium]|nr:50S ribosomal protein L18 [bacterium]
MSFLKTKLIRKRRRILRLKQKISGTAERPRICITRTNKNIYVQAINDVEGKTLSHISTIEKSLNLTKPNKSNKQVSTILAEKFYERLKNKNIDKVVLDRRDKKYHGVVKIFADKLREKGIKL